MKAHTILYRLFIFSAAFIPMLLITTVLGLLGFISAHAITILAVITIFKYTGVAIALSYELIFALMIISGILRGFLRYGEHLTGHYTAFIMLANIRSKIFAKLRRLAPARLDDKDKGNLISMVTSDIEMLEIFYAHTIAPILIFVLHTLLMVTTFIVLGVWPLALIAGALYIVNGAVIPLTHGKKTKYFAAEYRTHYSAYATIFMDSVYGCRDLITLGKISENNADLVNYTDQVESKNKAFKFAFAHLKALSDFVIYLFMTLFLVTGIYLYKGAIIDTFTLVLSFILLLGSLGPSLALNALPSTLSHTLAAGERILTFLNEVPAVNTVTDGVDIKYTNAELKNVSFKYLADDVLDNVSLTFAKNKIYGILGPSGSGKSTILKLLMRFWDVETGEILLNGTNIKHINTNSLHENIAYMNQDTYIFNDTILKNIVLNKTVSEKRLQEVLNAAALSSFLATLPDGLLTNAGELGARLSGGERQRIGLARLLLHGGDLILLDEPTSNVDALSEALIIKALRNLKAEKTIIIVSHRPTTLRIADVMVEIADGKIIYENVQ